MTSSVTPQVVREQYRDSHNLDARIRLHQLFSTNPQGWYPWYLDHVIFPPHAQALELGCGPASLWKGALNRIPTDTRLTLTDYSPGMAKAAHAAITDTRFTFGVTDAQSLPFADEQFDLVFANHMLYHVPDADRAIAEIWRVLRPGGTFYAATNGLKHMNELDELAKQLTPHLFTQPDAYQRRLWVTSFALENGGDRIAQQFDQVEVAHYPDGLKITQAQPLVDYMLSMTLMQTLPISEELIRHTTEQLQARIDHDGPIHITKSSGVFIARK